MQYLNARAQWTHLQITNSSEMGFKNVLNNDVKWRIASRGGVFLFFNIVTEVIQIWIPKY